jgi:hypothetical protein
MFVVTNRIPVSEGHEDAFEDRFRHKMLGIEQSPGFVKNLILRPVSRRYDATTGAYRESEQQGYYLVQTLSGIGQPATHFVLPTVIDRRLRCLPGVTSWRYIK